MADTFEPSSSFNSVIPTGSSSARTGAATAGAAADDVSRLVSGLVREQSDHAFSFPQARERSAPDLTHSAAPAGQDLSAASKAFLLSLVGHGAKDALAHDPGVQAKLGLLFADNPGANQSPMVLSSASGYGLAAAADLPQKAGVSSFHSLEDWHADLAKLLADATDESLADQPALSAAFHQPVDHAQLAPDLPAGGGDWGWMLG